MLSIQEQQIVVDAIKPYHPIQIGVFGSVARGDDQKGSGVDIAYSLDDRFRFSLFDLGDLMDDLEAKLHRKVDLVSFDAMSPLLKKSILKDMIYIFNGTICYSQ